MIRFLKHLCSVDDLKMIYDADLRKITDNRFDLVELFHREHEESEQPPDFDILARVLQDIKHLLLLCVLFGLLLDSLDDGRV